MSAGGALAGHRPSSTDAYRVEVVTDLDELGVLERPWHRLLLASPTATAFASPAWLLTWYRHFQPRSGIYVVTVWRAGELVGIAPFARNRFGGRHAGFTLLVSAGTEHGDYGDPLLGPQPLAVAGVIVDHLVRLVHHEDTAVNLRRLRDDDPLLVLLEGRDDVACEPMGRHADNVIVRFADLDDPEAALARIARKRDLPRLRRRLAEAHGEVAFAGAAPDTAAALDDMRDFLARRWPPGEGPKLFASPGREAFTRDVTNALVAAGLARVSTLSAGGRTVAVTVDQQLGDRQVGDATSFDPDLRKFSVGLMHLHEVLASALDAGVAQVDLRAGDFPYKDQWATDRQGTRSIALVAPGPLGQAQRVARRLAMSVRARRLTRHEHTAGLTAAPVDVHTRTAR
jgi:CelD/BcsL family acetyltransferase involved in cellulose biosynthesis